MGDKDITLNYIDKLHNSLISVGKTLHSYIKWNFAICFLLIFLLSGEVKSAGKIDFIGMEFEFSFPLFIITLLCSMVWMLLQIISLLHVESGIHDEILRLYKGLEFYNKTMDNPESSPLEYPSFLTIPLSGVFYGYSKLGTMYSGFLLLVAIVLVFCLPIVVMILTLIKLSTLVGWKWWLVLLGIFLLIITAIAIARSIMRYVWST